MSIKKIALIGSGIIAGALITPMIYTSYLDKFINKEKKELKNIEIKETNKDSYFEANREFIVTIKDITPIILKINPQIDMYNLEDFKHLFNNSKYLVTLNMVKYPVYHKDAIKISLLSFNKNITNTLLEDKTGKEILNLIKKRVLEVIADVDNLKISKIKLKDINLELTDKYSKLDVVTKNISFNVTNKTLYTDKFKFKYEDRFDKANFEINNLQYKLDKIDLLNNNYKLKIANLDYNNSDENLEIKNITFNSKTKTILDKTSFINQLSIKSIQNININYPKMSYKIDDLKLNINFSNLYTPALMNLIQARKEQNEQKIINSFEKLIQKGGVFSISPLYIKQIELLDEKLDPLNLNLNVKLEPNNFNYTNTYLLDKIKGELTLKTTPKNINYLIQNIPQASVLKLIEKKVNNQVIIKLEYHNGKITSNGKPIF